MTLTLQLLLTVLIYIKFSHGAMDIYNRPSSTSILQSDASPGDPLFLSPLIAAGKVKEAKTRSKVTMVGVTGYSGFITVNQSCNSNLFFWFIPSQTNPSTAPLVVWLQGGPGATSLFGLFEEHGPYFVDKQNVSQLHLRKIAWTASHSVIYVDSPVGTGYSFTEDTSCYATNQEQVASDLYSFLTQFLTMFAELQPNPFFVTGESYGGKYVPAISYKIHTENQKSDTDFKINLQGLAMGNGICDPYSMMDYGDYLYQLGLIDQKEKDYFSEKESSIRDYIDDEDYLSAFNAFDSLILNSTLNPEPAFFRNVTGFTTYFNYLRTDDEIKHGDFEVFLKLNEIRKLIHVGNRTRYNGTVAQMNLKEDIPKSVKPWVEELLESGYRVLFYNGQLDIIVAYPLTVNFLRSMTWSGSETYLSAPRKIWRVGTEIAGYAKTDGRNMTEVVVRSAGHMVPSDQPYWAFDMISRFTAGKPF